MSSSPLPFCLQQNNKEYFFSTFCSHFSQAPTSIWWPFFSCWVVEAPFRQQLPAAASSPFTHFAKQLRAGSWSLHFLPHFLPLSISWLVPHCIRLFPLFCPVRLVLAFVHSIVNCLTNNSLSFSTVFDIISNHSIQQCLKSTVKMTTMVSFCINASFEPCTLY